MKRMFVDLSFALSVLVSSSLVAECLANADQRPVPPMPNACAETACAAIRSSAEMVCSEQMWDADVCEIVLADLQTCFDKCSSGQ